jgi:DNA-binding CsgD family transcriptional regulator
MTSEPDQAGVETAHGRAVGAIAWITLGTDHDPTALAGAVDHALRQLVQAVRADDCICPVATSCVAVQFGPVASAVPSEVLGDRLVRAIGPGLSAGRHGTGLTVALGIAAAGPGDAPMDTVRRARSASRTSTRALCPGDPTRLGTTSAVTVDETLAPRRWTTPVHGAPVGLRRRFVHRYGLGRVDGTPALVPGDGPGGGGHPGAVPRSSALDVLVVDPMAAPGDTPGFAPQTAAALAVRLGCRAGTAVVSPDEPLVMTVDGADVDLVVLVLDGAWVGRSSTWTDGAWGRPARLTAAYVDKGTPVLAVGAGAGAGALAACVAAGALAVFDLDRLAGALCSLDGLPVEEARLVAEFGFPGRFRSLLGLTAGERRVLFYLTEGWAAQDVADALVVSLTTVRSHIRSVLRKLEVRSQLAAVAIANSRDLAHHQVTAHS